MRAILLKLKGSPPFQFIPRWREEGLGVVKTTKQNLCQKYLTKKTKDIKTKFKKSRRGI